MDGKIHAHLVPREDASGSAAQAVLFAVVLDRTRSKRRPRAAAAPPADPSALPGNTETQWRALVAHTPQLNVFRVTHIVERKRITQK